jgi:flavodoxin
MKALVLYRSFYGNTKQVADAIAERLKELGYEAEARDVRQRLADLRDVEIVFNGAPTRMARVNRKSLGVLRKLKAMGFTQTPIAIFDTCAVIPTDPEKFEEARKWIVPGAAGILHKAAADLGLNVCGERLRCEVNGMKGPLVEGALEKARVFTDAFIAGNRKT